MKKLFAALPLIARRIRLLAIFLLLVASPCWAQTVYLNSSSAVAATLPLSATVTGTTTNLALTSTVPVNRGGTGLALLTTGGIYMGNGTNALAASALTDNGTVVISTEGLELPVGSYINFGSTVGSGGYGFRDNAGTVQYKNSGGSWTNLP